MLPIVPLKYVKYKIDYKWNYELTWLCVHNAYR